MALLRRPVGGGERQRVLNVGDVLLVERELRALRFVADQDGRAVRGLHAEEIVEVGLVGREDDVELRILADPPMQIARVVVVVQQGVGAQSQELRETPDRR